MNIGALLRDAVAAHQAGRKKEAEQGYARVLAADPANGWANYFLSVLAEERGDGPQALAYLRQSVEAPEPPAAALVALGNRELADRHFQAALAAYIRAERLRPRMVAAIMGKALALKRLGRFGEALTASHRALLLRRSWQPGMSQPPGELDPADARQMRRTNRIKLEHDADQLRYLCEQGALEPDYLKIAAAYEKLAESLPRQQSDTAISVLDDTALATTQFAYNRLSYLPEVASAPGDILSPGTDFASADAAFVRSYPKPVVIDDVLTSQALLGLQRFCREATIWFEVKDHGGHLGAYFEEGLGCQLLVDIAAELRQAFPASLGGLSLAQLWAYKYAPGGSGTDYHADIGRVSANLWIAADADCLDLNGGGLEIWPVAMPRDWDFHKANIERDAIRSMVAASSTRPLNIPHRCNRLVLFDANLFHRSARGQFARGYGRQRVNITFLYDA